MKYTGNIARNFYRLIMALACSMTIAALVLESSALAHPIAANPSRVVTAKLNAGGHYQTETLLSNGKVLVTGRNGSAAQPSSGVSNSVRLYNPVTGTWSLTGSLNTDRVGFTATLLQNGKVLIAGGWEDDVTLNSAELYDPETGTSNVTGNLLTARYSATATLLENGNVLVEGGSNDGDLSATLNSAELYDTATGTWSSAGYLNASRIFHTATLLPSGKVLVAGGYNWPPVSLASAELYDPATGVWSLTGNLNVGREDHTATLLSSGKVLVSGGRAWQGSIPHASVTILNSAELYDPATGAWSLTAITPGANTLQFSSASYSANEGKGHAAITITRTGDTSGPATVDYATTDSAGLNNCDVINGIASPRCDYVTMVGTLRFDAGETSKTIFIPLVDDSFSEGTESFQISLSDPSGASLGASSTATVKIEDNDSAMGSNPIDDPAFFIREQYIDLLGREPDPLGFAGWQNILNNCVQGDASCDRVEVSAGFFRSPEFQDRGYFTYRFYSTLSRVPHYNEFMPDIAKMSGFLTPEQLEANKSVFVEEFMNRQEFKDRYDSLTDPADYVDGLLQSVGLPDHPSRDAWIDGLGDGQMTRAQVLRGLVESAESYNKLYNEAFVVMQYFGYLRRDPDILYLDWIQTMNENGGDYHQMINGFVNSPEYRQRFGP